jgi:hypothetical protein
MGLKIRPSSNKNKKIDIIFKDKIISIGAKSFSDYPSYIKSHGLIYAKERQRLYKLRHEKDRKIKDTPGYYADQILW